MFRHLLRPLAGVAGLALAAGASLAAPCPASLVTMGGTLSSISTATVFDTTTGLGEARWDMGAGSVYMRSYGSLSGVVVDAFDDYDVTGVAPGTPVTVFARLTVDGAIWTAGCGGSGCSGMYQVTFFHGTDSLVVLHSDHMFTGRTDHHDEVLLPLTITAGQPERLEIRAFGRRNPGGAHQSEATCRLTFTGLDEGVGVASCKGFAGTVVPARVSTWGSLKATYR